MPELPLEWLGTLLSLAALQMGTWWNTSLSHILRPRAETALFLQTPFLLKHGEAAASTVLLVQDQRQEFLGSQTPGSQRLIKKTQRMNQKHERVQLE